MEAWRQFIIEVEKELGAGVARTWLLDLKIARFDAGNLYLEARDSFQISWFEEHVRPLLKNGLFNNNNRPVRVHISVPASKNETAKKLEEPNRFSIQPDPLDPNLTLEYFVPAKENMMAFK